MSRLIWLATSWLWCGLGTAGAAGLVASASARSDSGMAVTAGLNTAGATLLVMTIYAYGTDPATCVVTDSNSNNWRHLETAAPGSPMTDLWYSYNNAQGGLAVGGNQTFTASCGGAYGLRIVVGAYSGTLTGSSDPLDQQHISGSSYGIGAYGTGIITPTVNGELLVTGAGCWARCGTLAVTSTYTLAGDISYGDNENGQAYQVQATAAPISALWTSGQGGNVLAVIALFKTSAAVGGAPAAIRHKVVEQ